MNDIMNCQTQHSAIPVEDMIVSNIKKEASEEDEHGNERNRVDQIFEINSCNNIQLEKNLSQIYQIKVETEHKIIDDRQHSCDSVDNENQCEISTNCLQTEVQTMKNEIKPANELNTSSEKPEENSSCDIEHGNIKKECLESCYNNSDVIENNKQVVEELECSSNHKTKKLKIGHNQNEEIITQNEFVDGGAEINNYKCPMCAMEYPCLETFKLHIEFHSNLNLALEASQSKILSNDVDNKVTDSKSKKKHSCDMCSYTTTHLNNLRTHKRTHSGERPFACKECDYTSSQLVHLKSHQLIHLGLKPFSCDECDHTCRDLSHLKAHKLLHTGVKPFACIDCDFTCRVASQLRVHRRIHTGEKPFPCDECNFVGDYAHSLKEHKQIHTGEKPFACDKCGYSSRWLRHLKTHQRVHTGEKPYTCDECSYTSSQKSHLITHKRTHSGEKPYACDKCSYTSSQLTHIREHKRRHSEEKPYCCEKCSYKTRTSQELRRHKMSWGHGDLPPQPRTKAKVKKEPA